MTGTAGPGTGSGPWLRMERKGAAVVITLDRPGALNALSQGMQAELAETFSRLGSDPMVYAVVLKSAVSGAFSVGGDVREMTELARRDVSAARKKLGDELSLCWIAECLSKPTVSLIDGRVMGTGHVNSASPSVGTTMSADGFQSRRAASHSDPPSSTVSADKP